MVRAAAFLLAALPGLALAQPVPAGDSAVVISRFHAEIAIQPDGSLLVTEELRPRFSGSWNGVRRVIDLSHTMADGSRARLELEFLGATDELDLPMRAEVRQVDGLRREVRVWVPDARDRTAHVDLHYRVRGAIRFFAPDSTDTAGPTGPFDELYWQATGTDWDVPIEQASVRVVLPDAARPIQAAAYRGSPSSTRQVPVTREDDPGGRAAVSAGSGGLLASGQGLTIAVAWPAGSIPLPSGIERAPPVRFGPTGSVEPRSGPDFGSGPWTAWLPLLLPLLTFWVAHRAWSRRGRDPAARAVTVRWKPPGDLGPAEAGTLVDHSPGMHDVVSILVDLAVRGYLVIAEREKSGFLQFGKDYAFHLVRPRPEWDDLAAHERRFLDGLFGAPRNRGALSDIAEEGTLADRILESVGGEAAADSAPDGAVDSVLLSELRNEFYKTIPDIHDALFDALVAKGYYLRRPDKVRARWGIGAAAAAAVALQAGFMVGILPFGPPALWLAAALGLGVSAVVLAVYAFIMPARTERGARAREACLGFRRFLERVESPRYRRMIRSPQQFEEYLPYAMAFQCERQWAEAFEGLLSEPPQWYHGTRGAFDPGTFASDIGTLASTAGSSLASSPSSSGSGGGGSVGGGSGGGGGGGF